MPAADIICFSKDWHEPKTSNNHVMEELAKRHRILWINSITTRNPNLGSGNDLRKIARKIRSWFRGVVHVNENLRVLTPIVIPLPHSRIAQKINRALVRRMARREMRRWNFRAPQLWIFPPNAVDYIGGFGESLVVYYCVDEWAGFTHLDADFIRQKENELLRKAHVVFVSAVKLLDARRAVNANTHLMPHGVNHALFAEALAPDFTPSEELRALPRPIIGFYGNLYDWVDQQLLADIARLRPSWSLVLIGKIMSDISALQACPNIHVLGARPYETLPSFCAGFDVGIIPYKLSDPRMETVNPLKLREYLAAGLPVVSVSLPEVLPLQKAFPDDVKLADNAAAFVSRIEDALRHNTAADKRRRSEAMRSESWTSRVAEIERVIAESDLSKRITDSKFTIVPK